MDKEMPQMTDAEIIKAFGICYTGDEEDCLNCPYCDEDGECMDKGDSKLLEEVGYLLNRKNAMIAELEAEVENLKKFCNDFSETLSNNTKKADLEKWEAVDKAKSEAYREFAELVNRRLNSNTPRGAYLYNIMKDVEKELTEKNDFNRR